MEILNYRKDGSKFWNALSLSPVYDRDGKLIRFIGVQNDVTGVKSLQAQYLQAQKMDAIGQLAGGVALDFKNLLSVILGYSDMLLSDKSPAMDPIRQPLLEIESAGQKAAGLTRQLLAFSRKQTLQLKILNLNAVVKEMEQMLHRLIGENIALSTRTAGDLKMVRADCGQVEQVLLNLTVNARDAMPSGGFILIKTENVSTHGTDGVQGLPAGEYVLLSVADTGTGMSEEVKERIFEPFFTTKDTGQGSGLGLATCYGIVAQLGGIIAVESELGLGTTFKLYLPAIEGAVDETLLQTRLDELPKGTETILLVEDERALRVMTSKLLRKLGYTVHEADDGAAAIRLLSDPAKTVQLVLTDVIMPSMGGKELADWIAIYRPAIPVIFTSGYIADPKVRLGIQDAPFLQKPVPPAMLAHKLREVLSQ